MKKSKNVVKYRKPLNINIGVVIFIIIFIYLIFNIFTYLTETHISFYEVEQGTMATNNVYTGLVLRSENVYHSDYSGALNYYIKEATKVKRGELVCSIDTAGDISNLINEASQDGTNIDSDKKEEIEADIEDFQYAYDSLNFNDVYLFKTDINAALQEALSTNALNDISDYVSNAENNNTFYKMNADSPGIVAYYIDGFEDVTIDNFEDSMLDSATYTKTSLKSNKEIQAGDVAYKLIDSEYWNIVLKVPAETLAQFTDDSVVHIKFLKDDKEIYANYTVQEKNGQNYLILSLKSSMIRYALDRYLEIELLLSEKSGLKIPNSSIVEKEFYTIPVGYFLKGGDSTSEGLLVESTDEDGESVPKFISPTIYYETDEFYYIDSEDITAGERIIKESSRETYVVGSDTASLKGVYNINKGYAVFKQIDELYSNGEYTIVRTGTNYGIALYDHIVLDGSKINENDLVK